MLFEKWWGNNDGSLLYYANELPNGDFILVGGRKSTLYPPGQGAWENYVCRIDFSGNIIWEKEVGFPNAQDYGGGVVRTSWNTYLLVGTTMGDTLPGYRNVAVRHIDADGNILFERYFTSGIWNEGGSVIETNDSCFVMLCYLGIPSTFNQAPGMIKIDRYGNEIWRHRQDSLEGAPYFIKQTSDSGFIVVGGQTTYNNSYYAKYKSDGNMDWIKYPFGLVDTIPNNPSVLRVNQDGTFDIYYGTYPTIYGLFKHYDSQGNCLTTQEYYDPFLTFFSCNNSDSAIWSISTNTALNILEDDNVFRKKIGLEGWDTLNKGIFSYIKTSDGGYLGVGQYIYDPQNVESQLYFVKFSSDARYQPDQFSESVNAYPNPATDGNITLTFDMKKDDDVKVDVFSADGKLIYSNSIFCPANSHTELSVRLYEISANGGMYILQAKTSDAVIRKKLVVMRQN
ncbi:MAG: hypothetical protein A2W11_07415 [Ignavibacteria bacterium RBG_16_35_7]|nr:MAG: hypothetical protein A2W11_07415 [Ignavibacteria bacterium RBG_16_35_7]